jgi:hypothetical protein
VAGSQSSSEKWFVQRRYPYTVKPVSEEAHRVAKVAVGGVEAVPEAFAREEALGTSNAVAHVQDMLHDSLLLPFHCV